MGEHCHVHPWYFIDMYICTVMLLILQQMSAYSSLSICSWTSWHHLAWVMYSPYRSSARVVLQELHVCCPTVHNAPAFGQPACSTIRLGPHTLHTDHRQGAMAVPALGAPCARFACGRCGMVVAEVAMVWGTEATMDLCGMGSVQLRQQLEGWR